MVRESSELYVYAESMEWSFSTTRKFHPALALTCSRLVADGRLASLLASSFRNATANLVLVDLRTTAITDVSLVTILQTCPSLKDLDVGECQNFSVLKRARHLKQISLKSLVVRNLQKMEICGTGDGPSWVGYRQQVGFQGSGNCSPDWCIFFPTTVGIVTYMTVRRMAYMSVWFVTRPVSCVGVAWETATIIAPSTVAKRASA